MADRVSSLTGRIAVLKHSTWLSVDLVGELPVLEEIGVGLIASFIAEFCDDTVLGLMRLPKGPIIGYDALLIPKLRNRDAAAVFAKGPLDRTVGQRQMTKRLPLPRSKPGDAGLNLQKLSRTAVKAKASE